MSDRENELRAWARSDDVEQRVEAADAEDLPVDLMHQLLRDPDEQVVGMLLWNHVTTREVLDEARTLLPDQVARIAEHPNAPFDLAEALPLWKHTFVSITSYCQGRGLGDAVRDRVVMAWSDVEPTSRRSAARLRAE